MVISGLGNPDAMIRSVENHGFTLTQHLQHRDHAAYSDADGSAFLQRASDADAILIPAKDWVKLRELPSIQACSRPILVPQVRIEFSTGASRLSGLISGVCGRSIAL
jgi:tetraacyldisaccharide-1-P 4'-kinase